MLPVTGRILFSSRFEPVFGQSSQIVLGVRPGQVQVTDLMRDRIHAGIGRWQVSILSQENKTSLRRGPPRLLPVEPLFWLYPLARQPLPGVLRFRFSEIASVFPLS